MSLFQDLAIPPSRRQFLNTVLASLAGCGASGWLPAFADSTVAQASRRQCILLWMNGGPSQIDTFDLKPGHRNGGTFQPIGTSAEGVRFSEHLPLLATRAHHLALLRGMSTREG